MTKRLWSILNRRGSFWLRFPVTTAKTNLSYDGPYLSLSRLLPCPRPRCTMHREICTDIFNKEAVRATHSQQNDCSDMCIIIVTVIFIRQPPEKWLLLFNIPIPSHQQICLLSNLFLLRWEDVAL